MKLHYNLWYYNGILGIIWELHPIISSVVPTILFQKWYHMLVILNSSYPYETQKGVIPSALSDTVH